MTANQSAKMAGLSGLAELSELSGMPKRTLDDWTKTRPVLFDVILMGCKVKKEKPDVFKAVFKDFQFEQLAEGKKKQS
jgi:hypothetical protein